MVRHEACTAVMRMRRAVEPAPCALRAVGAVLEDRLAAARAVHQVRHAVQRPLQRQRLQPHELLRRKHPLKNLPGVRAISASLKPRPSQYYPAHAVLFDGFKTTCDASASPASHVMPQDMYAGHETPRGRRK